MLMPSRRACDCAAQSFLLPSAKRKVDDCKGFLLVPIVGMMIFLHGESQPALS